MEPDANRGRKVKPTRCHCGFSPVFEYSHRLICENPHCGARTPITKDPQTALDAWDAMVKICWKEDGV